MFVKKYGFCLCLVLFLQLIYGSLANNPCDTRQHHVFPDYPGAFKEDCTKSEPAHCHRYIDEKWYVLGGFAQLLNRCPTTDCGTDFPAWMKGSYPVAHDGVVNRTVCVKVASDCCKYQLTIRMKNCTDFIVYYLKQMMECPSTYCFDSKLPCTTSTTSTTTSTTALGTTSVQKVSSEKDVKMTVLVISTVLSSVAVITVGIIAVVFCMKSAHSPFKTSKTNPVRQVGTPPHPYGQPLQDYKFEAKRFP